MNGGTVLGAAQVTLSTLLPLGRSSSCLARVFVATAPAPNTARASLEQLKYSAYTNAQAAHVTVTNLADVTRWACIQGVVTGKKGGPGDGHSCGMHGRHEAPHHGRAGGAL